MLFFIDIILGKDCGDPTANLTILKQKYYTGPSIPGPNSEGAIFQINCLPGYFWQDLETVKVMKCEIIEKWSFYEACLRMIS